MKRISIAILAVLLVGALVFSGCASSSTKTLPPQTAPAAPAPTYHAPAATSAPAYIPRTTMAPPPVTAKPGMTQPGVQATQPPPIVSVMPPIAPVMPATNRPAPTTAAPAYSYPAGTYPASSGGGGGGAGAPSAQSSATIGLSAGGAKDIQNFRENIKNSYLPLPTDVTYEGLFYDYYFDTGDVEPTNKLYSPSYSFAVTRDPISNQSEYYLSIGLNSGMKESDFARKKLNLVIVLDNSGSMGDYYNEYYYDRYGRQVNTYAEEGLDRFNKIRSATECVVSILDQLKDDDRVAIVTFNSNAHLEKPMGLVRRADMRDVKNHVLDISAGGSTNLDAGMDMAARQFNDTDELNSYEYENRIMVLTDAQPNTGDISSSGLMRNIRNGAGARIYTTIIGIGVDFNTDLIEEITKEKGANYYSVHSPREFRDRVEEQFDYMVTPLIFNLELIFESKGWRIEKVFGSPEAVAASGKLMKINTLFASKSDESGAVKGGLVLLKLRKTSGSNEEKVYLKTSYEDRNGRTDGDTQTIYLEAQQPEYFANNGIRKGVLLTRYAALLKNWMIDQRQHVNYNHSWQPCVREDSGIIIPDEYRGQWERQSLPLSVSDSYQSLFKEFKRYFENEMDRIDDDSLGQELDIVNLLSRY
jgi:Ca-activated chloride channel homolog